MAVTRQATTPEIIVIANNRHGQWTAVGAPLGKTKKVHPRIRD